MTEGWNIWIDTGGTFTDCLATDSKGEVVREKVLSEGVLRYEVSRVEGHKVFFNRDFPIGLLKEYNWKSLSDPAVHGSILDSDLDWIQLSGVRIPVIGDVVEIGCGEEAPVLAIRLITGTSLDAEFPGMDVRLGSTKGTNALLEDKGEPCILLVTQGFKDVLVIGDQRRPDLFQLDIPDRKQYTHQVVETSARMNARGEIIAELEQSNIDEIKSLVQTTGVKSVSISLLHAYKNPLHEKQIKEALLECGVHVTVGHEVSGEVGYLARTETSVVNAYLAPIMERYLDGVASKIGEGNLSVMTSSGGLVKRSVYQAKDSLLSGPAGGVVGAHDIAGRLTDTPILTLDMGGTSTDVARFTDHYDYLYKTEINGAQIQSPSIFIETVAAGGGSICSFDGKKLCVGPESAGASPGPACYGHGGPLTITDVNFLLGRLIPDQFSIPLKKEDAQSELEEVKMHLGWKGTDEQLLEEFLAIANLKMAEAMKKVSVRKGFSPEDHVVLAFGGAGGLHAFEVAETLGVETVILPFDAGILSSYGIGRAKLQTTKHLQVLEDYVECESKLQKWFLALEEEGVKSLKAQGANSVEVDQRIVLARLQGQEACIEVGFSHDFASAFRSEYERTYKHWLADRNIEIVSIKVFVKSTSSELQETNAAPAMEFQPRKASVYERGQYSTIDVVAMTLGDGQSELLGPLVLTNKTSTSFVPYGWAGSANERGDYCFSRVETEVKPHMSHSQEAQLELFSNRLFSIAELMGETLMRLSFSVNIKDRLDFSCAILDSQGSLVVNAPHIPVHLGALGVCVREVQKRIEIQEGDVVVTNHPAFGGSHLPDVTLIAPVFNDGELVAYVANRAHHAEIGGKTPGSMPPDAISLEEEGVVIAPFKLIEGGRARWDEMESMLANAKYPTRMLTENIADLNAGLASLQIGVDGLVSLCDEFGVSTIQDQMDALLSSSSDAALQFFESRSKVVAEDELDDGTPLHLEITPGDQSVLFDFTKMGDQLPYSLNATSAILSSAVLYCLRLLTGQNVPLNEGFLRMIELRTKKGTLVDPVFVEDASKCPPVVGGNVETSQRLVDLILSVLDDGAGSHGSMNNVIFGNSGFGYYETIGGGCGAGNGYSGRSGVHQHMTNTRITDPEVLELRYPVVLEEFALRAGSGGKGLCFGGDGLIRRYRFTEEVILSVLMEHRRVAPYGQRGGDNGLIGDQRVIRKNGDRFTIRGREQVTLSANEIFEVKTPGGGGFGA